jgi:hypothetical protein
VYNIAILSKFSARSEIMDILKNLPSPINVDKKDIIDTLLREEYGYLPARPYSVSATVQARDRKFCAG